MSKQTVIVHMKSGHIQNRKPVTQFFHSLKDGHHLLEANSTDKRTNPQNRYYFGLVIPLIQHGLKDMGTEATKDEVHEWLKAKFNYIELVNEDTGQVELLPQSTTKLNKEKFGEYIEKIQRFSAEFLNVVIPDPGQQTQIEYESIENSHK